MSWLHPEFLYLAPLVTLPILIHLLNRIRYRRMRWAAIEFLLTSDQRAVRRARLRHLLLMALRTLLLAAALGALAQPVFRGRLAALLGGSRQLAALVDASASMSAVGASGTTFDQAKEVVSGVLESLPRGTPALAGTFAVRQDWPFRQPVQDHAAVAGALASGTLTDGAADVPGAIRAAADALGRTGGGGTVWVVTDLQADGWHAMDTGRWEQARQALHAAGDPRVVVTDVGSTPDANASIAGVRTLPAILVAGDSPTLAATVVHHGTGGAVATVSLVLDGRRIDSRTVEFTGPGKADCVFRLPVLTSGVHAGHLELAPDAVPADDRYYFVLRTATSIPLLLVDGAPSSALFEGAADFLAVAARPPDTASDARSPFAAKVIPADRLPGTALTRFAAVCLADVPRLDPEATKALRDYVSAGGLVLVFPGAHTHVRAWNRSAFPGVPITSVAEAPADKPMRVTWTAPTHPVCATLPDEGLDRLAISRLFRLDPKAHAHVLARTDRGDPFLVRRQVGKGKVYVFAVSAQTDLSNLPLTPVLLLVLHRAVRAHLVTISEPPAGSTFAELRLRVPPGSHRMRTPDGRTLPVTTLEHAPGQATFNRTERAGLYRLVATQPGEDAPPCAALNVPPGESAPDRIDPHSVRTLLSGSNVRFLRARAHTDALGAGTADRSAASGFPLAALALVFLLGEVLLAWSIGRPRAASAGTAQGRETADERR